MRLKVHTIEFAPLVPVYRMEAARNGEPFGRCVELANPVRAAHLLHAPNSDFIFDRKGKITRIFLFGVSDESGLPSHAGGIATTYDEQLGGEHCLTTLKKISKSGSLVRWSGKESFTRGRFNPDHQVGQVRTRKSWKAPLAA